MTMRSTPLVKHKLAPYEIITGQPMPLMIELYPALVNTNITRYCNAQMQYAKAYIQQIAEAFRDTPLDEVFTPMSRPAQHGQGGCEKGRLVLSF